MNQSVSVPAHGKALIESGAVRYTPAANFFGRDSFTYTVTDNKDSSTATVTIDVLPVDDEPVARDDTRTTNEEVSVLIPVLANDSDFDAVGLVVDTLTAAAHGTVAIEGAGVRYVPAANYHGTDGFSYTLRDGKGRTAGASGRCRSTLSGMPRSRRWRRSTRLRIRASALASLPPTPTATRSASRSTRRLAMEM